MKASNAILRRIVVATSVLQKAVCDRHVYEEIKRAATAWASVSLPQPPSLICHVIDTAVSKVWNKCIVFHNESYAQRNLPSQRDKNEANAKQTMNIENVPANWLK